MTVIFEIVAPHSASEAQPLIGESFLKREPMLTGILGLVQLPPQSTFWRFLASLHLGVACQLPAVQRQMRQRVRQAAGVELSDVTVDTDTPVHTLFGNQMGARKGYHPKNQGKKSYPADPDLR